MTTTVTPDPATPATPATSDDVALDRIDAHPDNVRHHLGDLAELVRSIKTYGVLQPLLVLPADDHGTHLIVAGHRRHAAALAAGLTHVPVVVRDLDRRAVIEAMLIENGSRDNLSVRDEVDAIAKLITIDTAVTPAKLCKRIGKSQRWVRDRMAVTVLPARWLDALDNGRLTVAQAVAAASAADLGPDGLDAVCEELSRAGGWHHDSDRLIENYRRRLKLDADEASIVAECQSKALTHWTGEGDVPRTARTLQTLGIADTKAGPHSAEPCHAVLIRRSSWSDTISLVGYCTQPKRHRPSSPDRPAESAVTVDRARNTAPRDDSHQKRRARLARLAAGTEMFARRRGGPSASALMVLALQSFMDHASHDATLHAVALLGLDGGGNARQALDAHAAAGAAGLAQAAGAVACGTAEAESYHSTSRGVTAWYRLLIDHGWQPDDWTSERLTDPTSPDVPAARETPES